MASELGLLVSDHKATISAMRKYHHHHYRHSTSLSFIIIDIIIITDQKINIAIKVIKIT